MDTSKNKAHKQDSVLDLHNAEVLAELERTRQLLRNICDAFLEEGWTMTGALAMWYAEDQVRKSVEA